jgi:CarD family transcriptional regulator
MTQEVSFAIGDKVVYPTHGVGVIVDQEVEIFAGMEVKVFVIYFEQDKMTLRVPVKKAASVLRILANKNTMKEVLSVLQGRAKISRGMWSRRAQEYEGKINSGDITFVAEVVRDLHKNVKDPERSYSERVIYESALNRLAGEVAAIENIDMGQAQLQIIDVLSEKEEAA